MFRTEKELVDTILSSQSNLSSFTNWNNLSDTEILDELDLGFGIADLVLAKYSHQNSERTIPLNYNDLSLYQLLEKKGSLEFDNIKEITRTSERNLKDSLKKLQQEGFIRMVKNKYCVKKPMIKKIEAIAIEAKLKNWKRALKQAYRYKWFASYSFVVMDANYIRPALKNREHFKKFNVGLASITKAGGVTILFKPQKIKPIDETMHYLLAEHLYFRAQK